ncbi:TPA: hypothetical protein QIB83_003475 [Morganella morganii subsp. morganii]|nr:hypothetical protein [Morganella morganii subsp. morganii]
MRRIFEGFYDLTLDEEKGVFESDKTIFVFDANCFLNLYRCEDETKKDFMAVVDNIKDKLWFPFQVGLEYQRNRLTVISKSLKDLNEMKKSLSEITNGINVFCEGDKNIKNKYHELHKKLIELKGDVSERVRLFVKENIDARIERGDYISNPDDVRRWVDTISKGKVSSSFTQEEVNKINKEGEVRYKNKIGPGWMDEREKGEGESFFNNIMYKDKFGDLYLWKELLKKANEDDIDNVVFITNDLKEDWWYRIHGKTIGPLEVLKTEITNQGVKEFKMYNQSTFVIKFSEIFKDISVNKNSIKELEMLNKQSSKNINETLNVLDKLYKTTGLSQIYDNPVLKKMRDFNDKYASAIELSNRLNFKKHLFEEGHKSQGEKKFLQEQLMDIDEEISQLEGECIFLHSIDDANRNDEKQEDDEFTQELESITLRIEELKLEQEYIQKLIDSK